MIKPIINKEHQEHGCKLIDFENGKLYKICFKPELYSHSHSRNTLITFFTQGADQKIFLDKGEVLMFVEYEKNELAFDGVNIKFIWKSQVIFFKGAICSLNFEPVVINSNDRT